MYDFVLFENYYRAYNHYKDVCIIAEMLRYNGYSVAIADVFGEGENCQIEGVPHISFKRKCPVDVSKMYRCNVKYIRSIVNSVEEFCIDLYLRYVMRELAGKYRHLYAGSYFIKMTLGWLKLIPPASSVFFWGLRSSRLSETKENAIQIRRYFDRNKNLKFFVSNNIIYEEFLSQGISPDRLVIRPERYIRELTINERLNPDKYFNLLTIGTIRREKRIELCLQALSLLKSKCVRYTIAGRAVKNEYETIIESQMSGMDNVIRINKRLSEEEYNSCIKDTDFLVLCDMQQDSTVTNGTLAEALLQGKPVIAPDYEPYKSIIEAYGVGLLFDGDSAESLSKVIEEAAVKGASFFRDNIIRYQTSLLFETVSRQFGKDISLAIS